MIAARQLLRTLCDVEGVVGSFLLSDTGGLVATDLPATFDAAAFAEAGPRIVRLAELGGSYGEETRFFVIRFSEYKLYVRVLRGALLGVLVGFATSMPALRAAAGVVARRAETLLADAARGADTARAPQHFEAEPAPYSEPAAPSEDPRPSRPPGAAIGASASLTNTLPSMTLPEPEKPVPPQAPSRRAIRFRGRAL